MPVELIIFDCDGVLFDSRPANVAFHNAVLDELGQPRLDAEGEDLGHYLAAGQLYDHLFGTGNALRARASEVARALDYSPFYELMRPVPGLYETLSLLDRSYRLAMASNRSRTVHVLAERFELKPFLQVVVGAGDVENPKPAPDMLLYCCQRLSVATAAALYVGDASTDRLAAEAAGMCFIGVGDHSGAGDPIPDIRALPARLIP